MIRTFFDTETDGLVGATVIRQERWPRIIELYAVAYDEETKVDEIDMLINPGRKIDKEIIEITGITNEMLIGQPMFPAAGERFRSMLSQSQEVYAHNLSFDKTVVDLEMVRMKVGLPIVWPRLICTVEASEHYLMRRLKLVELHEHLFGAPFASAHRARNDVEAMVKCFFEMKRRGDI